MDKQHILNEIRRTAKENGGKALGRERFFRRTGIREQDCVGVYWTSWSEAVQEAGLSPNKMNAAISDDVILKSAATLTRELGHFPRRADLNLKRRSDRSFPSEKTFRRFGAKAQFARAVLEWCGEDGSWSDVAEICKPIAAADTDKKVPVDTGEQTGFVYLMKSGKYYKIGHTNSLDRRQYEIGLQLPEGITPIHSIRTDDPSGIEAYWHNRFREKRMQGEWFKLTAKDVAIFKKRKFM